MDPIENVILTAIWEGCRVILSGLQHNLAALFGFLQWICEDGDESKRDDSHVHVATTTIEAHVVPAKMEVHVAAVKMESNGDKIREMEQDMQVPIGMPCLRQRLVDPVG